MLLDYMHNRYKNVLDNLVVYPDRMLENINLTNGVIFSQRVMNAIIEKGKSWEEAYDIVQVLARKAYLERISFKELLFNDEKIMHLLTKEDIESSFTLDYYFKNVSEIYKRCEIE